MLKVKCIQKGYIGHKRKYEGDVFFVEKKDFSKVWMDQLSDDNKEPVTVHSRVDMTYSMTRLFDYCKTHNLKNYSGMDRKDLVEAINSGDLDEKAPVVENVMAPGKAEVIESDDVI